MATPDEPVVHFVVEAYGGPVDGAVAGIAARGTHSNRVFGAAGEEEEGAFLPRTRRSPSARRRAITGKKDGDRVNEWMGFIVPG